LVGFTQVGWPSNWLIEPATIPGGQAANAGMAIMQQQATIKTRKVIMAPPNPQRSSER
jgi:hypothetical protein